MGAHGVSGIGKSAQSKFDRSWAFRKEQERQAVERAELQAYRALGTVEELSALVKAQEEGRAFISPIALEQKIYKLSPLKSGALEWMVIRVMKSKQGFDFEVISYSGITHRFSDEAIGKTVFLTRAEAEAALNGGGGDA